jgi:hypothetical protein
VVLRSSAASTATVRAARVASRDLTVRSIVTKLPWLLSAERDGKSKPYSKRRECSGLDTWLFPFLLGVTSTVARPS